LYDLDKSIATASAPAKIILFGEHFVVYDNPAILGAINKRIKVTVRSNNTRKIIIKSDLGLYASYTDISLREDFKIRSTKAQRILYPLYKAALDLLLEQDNKNLGIEMELVSDIPSGVGLGSSAASCVATVAAVTSLFHRPEKNWICSKAVQAERIIHKNSSGADCYISTFGGLMYFLKNKQYKAIKSKNDLCLLMVNTGISHCTKALVSSVKKFRDQKTSLFKDLSICAYDICERAMAALTSGNENKIGELMNENHRLLQEIGVSHHKIDEIIQICLDKGALGAKLTGAGGGGSLIALAPQENKFTLISEITKESSYQCIPIDFDFYGLLIN
jgi:mevalonate kinase